MQIKIEEKVKLRFNIFNFLFVSSEIFSILDELGHPYFNAFFGSNGSER